ncbi:AraC family transcriptional regulator [Methylobacterium sp. BTF04]|uniref:AraC family transcriptional regulator n=1 Tax=Methylobacterium sp. BTF04 TaxID=2708300 RepID=UPI0013D47CFA|nr:AraC family transcriptional regulator [Methylobacterium sp. BTF04]NEU13337.1 AraC family transcriptional regulator [Methylobacterium sp. BTF04]
MSSSAVSRRGIPSSWQNPAEPFSGPEILSPIGLTRPGVAQAVYITLVELGANPDDLIAEVGLDPRLFDGSATGVPYASLGRLIALGADRTGCPHLGLLVGQRATLASLGLLGLLMGHSETIGDALRALEAHSGVQNWGAVVGLGIDRDVAVFSYCPYGPEAEGAALHSDRALATTTSVLRTLCGANWALLEVLLPRSAPQNTAPFGDFFRAPVRFDQEMAALVFPAKFLEQRIAGANPAVRLRAEGRIRQIEARHASNLTDALRQYLRVQVTRQRCKAERFARLRLLNRRTLSRRLKAEGTTFKHLVNETQYQVAKQLLTDTSMSMTQISAVLEFSEPAAFSHAFRRWSGMTPSAWRCMNQTVKTRGRQQADDPDTTRTMQPPA